MNRRDLIAMLGAMIASSGAAQDHARSEGKSWRQRRDTFHSAL